MGEKIITRWAAWEEKVGESGEASRILEQLELAHPGLVNVLLKRVNLERRRGRIEEACKLYEAAIKAAKTATASDLAVKYSRYLPAACLFIQGVFFNWFLPKSFKCQSVSKF